MTDLEPESSAPSDPVVTGHGRAQLLWSLLVFQLKLLVDGLRDLVLSPLAFGAVLLGLIAGGKQPDQYLRRLLDWGKRTEHWINLFGQHSETSTADTLIEPLKTKTFNEAERNPLVRRISGTLNDKLDRINVETSKHRGSD